MAELKSLVDRWVETGLISRQQGEAILAEHTSPLRVSVPRGSLIAEALAYVGGALVLLAAIAIASIYWPSLGLPARSALTGAATAIVVGAGIVLPQAMGAARARLRAVLWVLAVALCGVWLAISFDGLHWTGEKAALPPAAGACVLALVLWRYQKSVLQQGALAISLAVTVGSAAALLPDAGEPTVGLAIWALGLPWLALAWGTLMVPQRTAYLLGGVALVTGSQLTTQTHWGLALAGITVVALVTAAVLVRDLWLLGVGSVGVLVTVPVIIDRFFPGELAVPFALLGAGALLIVLGVLTARRRGQAPAAEPRIPATISPRLAAAVAVCLALASIPFILLAGGAI